MSINELQGRVAAALAALLATERQIGVAGAMMGRHIAGPSRGNSVVAIKGDLAGLLRDVLAELGPTAHVEATIASAFGPTSTPGMKVTSSEPSRARFRNLEMD